VVAYASVMSSAEKPAGSASGVDKGVVLFVAATAAFLTPFMGSSINIALPSIGREFGSSAVALSWISTIYLLAAAMFLVPIGRLADIHGRKKVFLSGMIGYTIMSLLCGLAASEAMLIALRALQGVSDAMMFGTAMAIVTSVYPPAERGRAIGISVAAVYAGLAFGPAVGGLITQYLGWRPIFFLTTILGAVVVALTIWKMRGEWAEARGQKMDVLGSALYAAALLAIMYGFRVLPDATGGWLMLAGVACLAVFVIVESRTPSPVLHISLFRNVTFALSNLSALINYAATFALGFLLSLYLQYIKGLDPHAAGLVLLIQPVMMAALSPLAGRLSDRVEPRVVSSIGMALTTAGLAMAASLGASATLGHLIGILVLCGLGFALFSSPNTNAIMGSVSRAHYGVAAATTAAMRLIGQMLSMGIAAMIIALYLGQAQVTPDRYPAFLASFRFAFLVFSALCLAGVFASLARGKLHA
jgi:EmrB/QacA subfamily drug resistance transporter